MTLSVRHRAGLILVGLSFGAVIAASLVGASAYGADGTTITFSGTPLLGSALSCPSTPSQTTLHITAGTVVNFVNRTGRQATLWAGDAEKSLPNESLVPVTFNGGPSSVVIQMLPDCSLDLGKHVQMIVYVTAANGATPTPIATPIGGGPATLKATVPASLTPTTSAQGTAAPSKSAGAVVPKTSSTDDENPFAQAPASLDAQKPTFGSVGTTQPDSASGLLTLIATVGVVGVSAAAIRAIVAQRGSRVLSA